MNATQGPDAGANVILDSIEVTEGVYSLPATVRGLSPDELEAVGLPRAFLSLTPVQKAAAVRAAYGETVEAEAPLPPATIGEFEFTTTDDDDDADVPYSVPSEEPRSDEELDAELKRYEEADEEEDESSPE